MDFIKHHSHFSFRFAFFLTLASLPTAPSGLGTQRDAAPASLCSSSRCFWLLTHPNLLLFTHFLRQAAWWVMPPSSSCLPSVVAGQSFLNRLPLQGQGGRHRHHIAAHFTEPHRPVEKSHCPGPQQEEGPAQPFLETQSCPWSHRVTQSEPSTPETPTLIKPALLGCVQLHQLPLMNLGVFTNKL